LKILRRSLNVDDTLRGLQKRPMNRAATDMARMNFYICSPLIHQLPMHANHLRHCESHDKYLGDSAISISR